MTPATPADGRPGTTRRAVGSQPATTDGAAGDRSADEPRFPGLEVTSQSRHWDPITAGVVLDRLRSPEPPRYFTLAEEATADALFDRLLDQGDDRPVPVTAMVDARLAEQRTDGWRYEDMPEDGQAWKRSLALLDQDAQEHFDAAFADCIPAQQRTLLGLVHDLGGDRWHDLPAGRVWSLWTRYACTAFYSHPVAWNEIGFPGPAYPRGYSALGMDQLESFEIRDTRPREDPVSRADSAQTKARKR